MASAGGGASLLSWAGPLSPVEIFRIDPVPPEPTKMTSNNLANAVTPGRETTTKARSISDFFSKGAQVKRSFLVSCILILILTLLTFGQIRSQHVIPTQKNWTYSASGLSYEEPVALICLARAHRAPISKNQKKADVKSPSPIFSLRGARQAKSPGHASKRKTKSSVQGDAAPHVTPPSVRPPVATTPGTGGPAAQPAEQPDGMDQLQQDMELNAAIDNAAEAATMSEEEGLKEDDLVEEGEGEGEEEIAEEPEMEWDGHGGDIAMLMMAFDKEHPQANPEGCAPLDRMEVMAEYSKAAAEVEDMPILPERGLQALGKSGPFIVYIREVYAKVFADFVPHIIVKQQPLRTVFRRIHLDQGGTSSYDEDYIEASTFYLDVFLGLGAEFLHLNKTDIVNVLRAEYALVIIKSARPRAKHKGESLGKEFAGEKINVTCRPMGGAIPVFGERLQVSKEVTKGKWLHADLKFAVGAPKNSEFLKWVNTLCKSKCHRPIAKCICEARSAAREERQASGKGKGGKGKGAGRSAGRSTRQPKRPRATFDFLNDTLVKSDLLCTFFPLGKCTGGIACKFNHDPAIEAGEIECAVERRKGGRCRAGANCAYKHCAYMMKLPPEYRHKFNNHTWRLLAYSYWGHRWRIRFDSTLGYPGEVANLPLDEPQQDAIK